MEGNEKSNLRILMFTVDPLATGGVRNVFMGLADRLERESDKLVTAQGVAYAKSSKLKRFPLAVIERWRGIPTPMSLGRVAYSVMTICWTLMQLRPHIVNVHFVRGRIVSLLLMLRHVFRYKVVLSTHGSDVLLPEGDNGQRLPRLMAQADSVTAVTEAVASKIRAYPRVEPQRVHLIPNGIDHAFWSGGGSRRASDTATPTLLAVGRLHPVKGHDVLIRAMPRIRQRMPGASLTIVGEGPFEGRLMELIEQLGLEDAVELTGEECPNGVRDRLRDCDVFVLPSRSEGMPLALLEAMSAGVPTVATRVGGVANLVTKETGWVVPSEDPPALADAIVEVLSDPQRARTVEQAGHRMAQRYSESETYAAYAELFRKLCRRNGHADHNGHNGSGNGRHRVEPMARTSDSDDGVTDDRPRQITRIRPRRGWQAVDLRELWRARDLLGMFVVRDIKIQYKQTFFGFAWAIVVPLIQVVVFTVFFGNLLGVGQKNDAAMARALPYPLFVLTGQLVWTFFSTSVTQASGSLMRNAAILRKIYVPRLVLPFSSLGKPAMDSVIVFALTLAMLGWYAASGDQVWFSWKLLLAPLFFLGAAVPALGVGLILAALTVNYRDLRYVVPFGIQTLFFVTPVIFAGEILQQYEWLLYLNPIAGFLQAFRASVLDLPIDWLGLGMSSALSVAALVFGLFYFTRVERQFADVA